MSRGTWTIQVKSGGSWGANSTIYRPNTDFTTSKASTQSINQLADGSKAYVTPATKYIDSALMFQWYYDDGTTKTLVEGYVDNQNDLKITDDTDYIFYGRFVDIQVTRMAGISSNKYDIRATFEIMPNIA